MRALQVQGSCARGYPEGDEAALLHATLLAGGCLYSL